MRCRDHDTKEPIARVTMLRTETASFLTSLGTMRRAFLREMCVSLISALQDLVSVHKRDLPIGPVFPSFRYRLQRLLHWNRGERAVLCRFCCEREFWIDFRREY